MPQSQVEVLLIGLWPDVESLCLAIRHLRGLLPSIRAYGLLVMDERGSDLYCEGLDLARRLPQAPHRVLRSDRVLGVLSPPSAYTLWYAAVDPESSPRADHRMVDLRPLRMMPSGV